MYFGMTGEGRDPVASKVLTLQYQSFEDSQPLDNLTVMAEWEWSEKEIIRSILAKEFLQPGSPVRLVGFDLRDKLSFLVARAEYHGLLAKGGKGANLLADPPPLVDLGPLAFQGPVPSAYAHLRAWDQEVAALYRGRNLKAIVDHLHRERDISLDLYRGLRSPP